MRVALVATCLSLACAAANFPVAPGVSIADAVAKARAAGGTDTVTLAAGDWFLEETLALDARDARHTLRGAGAGRTRIWGGRRLTGWKPDGDTFWSADLPEVKDCQGDRPFMPPIDGDRPFMPPVLARTARRATRRG